MIRGDRNFPSQLDGPSNCVASNVRRCTLGAGINLWTGEETQSKSLQYQDILAVDAVLSNRSPPRTIPILREIPGNVPQIRPRDVSLPSQ
jgi:hypothetical protein